MKILFPFLSNTIAISTFEPIINASCCSIVFKEVLEVILSIIFFASAISVAVPSIRFPDSDLILDFP
ncbi:MAG TPA: hypothetical protein PK079_07385 [Leptospiraceae bacterium]|nr:hypothetical protein [Leptospiraceae bacterium]HMW05788.1 hypothetical protein [Leptospiraceae bacterium]HMX32623.1 hypothetical protein [Leptospiraceae bacterium]HMY33337.1 hypothetical protein [Leptospiraceae bacterium]HMZ66211.1 hypothetical protein [Leptospiraceae bacterium]